MTASEKMSRLQREAYLTKRVNPELRLGQAYMNTLYEIDKDLYKHMTGTAVDCFYQEELIEEFLIVVEEYWKNQENS